MADYAYFTAGVSVKKATPQPIHARDQRLKEYKINGGDPKFKVLISLNSAILWLFKNGVNTICYPGCQRLFMGGFRGLGQVLPLP